MTYSFLQLLRRIIKPYYSTKKRKYIYSPPARPVRTLTKTPSKTPARTSTKTPTRIRMRSLTRPEINKTISKEYTLISWNVYGFKDFHPPNDENGKRKGSSNVHHIIQLVTDYNPNILCLQEAYKTDRLDSLQNNIKNKYFYSKSSKCNQNKTFILNKNQIKYNYESYKYLKKQRCAVISIFDGIKIANVHVLGGRFEDKEYKSLQDAKKNQLEQLVNTYKPDIIVGDFNSGPDKCNINKLTNYLEKIITNNINEKNKYTNYLYSGVEYLHAQGYKYAGIPNHKTSLRGGNITKGIPIDLFWYNPNTIKVSNYNVIQLQSYKNNNKNIYASDHKPIKITFTKI